MNARSLTEVGFTIVETMIFLAISALMFVLAVNAMSGKTQQTEFQTGVNTLRSELNQQLSNVADGNYNISNTNCTAGTNQKVTYPSASPDDGTCVAIGEIISFNTSSFDVLPVLGRNYVPGSNTVVASDITQAEPSVFSILDQNMTMPFGLQIVGTPNIPTSISTGGQGAIGVFSFTSYDGTAGNATTSGAAHVEEFIVPGSQLNNTSLIIADMNSATINLTNCDGNDVCLSGGPQPINPIAPITFCVNSGTTNNESALFSIGGAGSSGGNATQAKDTIYSTAGC
jgi:type II secretory pathway pseudopilin PulG